MLLRNLSTFVQLSESGSFSKAAEMLGYSQPTVSIQIKQLEEELGTKLFDRIGHTVRLTERGRELLVQAQNICRICSEMSSAALSSDEARGTVRLVTADSMCAPLLSRGFSEFRERFPYVSLKVSAGGTDEMFRMLDHNEADIVCTLDTHIYDSNYVIATEQREGLHFVVSANNPLALHKTVPIEELVVKPFMLTEKGMSYRRLLDELLARDSLQIEPILETGHADVICHLVEIDAGLSFLPDYVTEEAVRKGSVVRLDVPGYEPELWKQLLYHKSKWLSPQLKAVIDHLTEILVSN